MAALDGEGSLFGFGEGLLDGGLFFGACLAGRGLPGLADDEARVLLLLGGWDEECEDLVALAQEDEIGAPTGEFKEQGASAGFGGELEQDHAVASNLLDATQARSGEFGCEALVEGTLGAGVALDAGVLEVDATRLALAGEVEAQNRYIGAVCPGEEGEHHIPWWAGLDVAQGGAGEERSELFDELADLSLVEVQLSSSGE